MFNPQRRTKRADIYMQQRAFQLHLQKMQQIKHTTSPISARYQDDPQRKYLEQISHSKQDLKTRQSHQLHHQNHRIFQKLMDADKREEVADPHLEPAALAHPHHNHYYIQRTREEKIKQENGSMINRLVSRTSEVPPLEQMKRDFSLSKRYGKMVRKLPTILKHEEQFKRDLSLKRLQESRPELTSSRNKLSSQQIPSQQGSLLQPIEKALLDK